MAGHSKWSKIKHKKGINDAKRGKIFSKYGQMIAIAARDGGGDLDTNFSLRLLVDKAKSASMPSDNIKRAIDRGTGKSGEAMNYEPALYEGFGPDGISVIVEALTDNKNRTVSELRQTFTAGGGSLGDSGSVSWNFDQKGLVVMRPAVMQKSEKFGQDDFAVDVDMEEVMMALMEIEGVLDLRQAQVPSALRRASLAQGTKFEDSITLEIYTDPKKLAFVRDAINELKYIIISAELVWVPNNYKDDVTNFDKIERFVDSLEDMDDVQNIFTDLE